MVGRFWQPALSGAVFAAAILWALTGCDSKKCQLHSDCHADELCVSGACEPTCNDDFDCPAGEACESGACVVDPDGGRPRPCDPASSEAGCPDTSSPPDAVADASTPADAATDALTGDASIPDSEPEPGDGGPEAGGPDAVGTGDAGPDGDAGEPDGSVTPSDIDLTGTYAVTRTVDLTNDDAFTEGDVAHFIANLTRLPEHARYRLDLIDPEGHALTSEVALDFRSPEGPLNYQFRYERPIDLPPPGCQAFEETFERGEVHRDPGTETVLDGQQILHGQYEGADCAEADRLTNFTVRWVHIPVPLPPGDAGIADTDAAGATDAVVPALADAAADATPPDAATPDAATPGADAR